MTSEKRMLLCALPALTFHALNFYWIYGFYNWTWGTYTKSIGCWVVSWTICGGVFLFLWIIVRPNRGTGHALYLAQQVAGSLKLTHLRALRTSKEIRVQVGFLNGDAGPLSHRAQDVTSMYMCVNVCVYIYESWQRGHGCGFVAESALVSFHWEQWLVGRSR